MVSRKVGWSLEKDTKNAVGKVLSERSVNRSEL